MPPTIPPSLQDLANIVSSKRQREEHLLLLILVSPELDISGIWYVLGEYE